jgi:hypothetical protein
MMRTDQGFLIKDAFSCELVAIRLRGVRLNGRGLLFGEAGRINKAGKTNHILYVEGYPKPIPCPRKTPDLIFEAVFPPSDAADAPLDSCML